MAVRVVIQECQEQFLSRFCGLLVDLAVGKQVGHPPRGPGGPGSKPVGEPLQPHGRQRRRPIVFPLNSQAEEHLFDENRASTASIEQRPQQVVDRRIDAAELRECTDVGRQYRAIESVVFELGLHG